MPEKKQPTEAQVSEAIQKYRDEFEDLATQIFGDLSNDNHDSLAASGFDLGYRAGFADGAGDLPASDLSESVSPMLTSLIREVHEAVSKMEADVEGRRALIQALSNFRMKQEKYLRTRLCADLCLPEIPFKPADSVSDSEALEIGVVAYASASPSILAFLFARDRIDSACTCLRCRSTVGLVAAAPKSYEEVMKVVNRDFGSLTRMLCQYVRWLIAEFPATIAHDVDKLSGSELHDFDQASAEEAARTFLGKFTGK